MGMSVGVAVFVAVIFWFKGRKLKRKLELEYGKPMRYNLQKTRESGK